MYFFISKFPMSHRRVRKNLKVSSFIIAFETKGSFCSVGRKLAVTIDSITSTKIASAFAPREYRSNVGIFRWYVCQSLYASSTLDNTPRIGRGGHS